MNANEDKTNIIELAEDLNGLAGRNRIISPDESTAVEEKTESTVKYSNNENPLLD